MALLLFILLAFQTSQIQLGDQILFVELALTPEEKCMGLMGRDSLAEDEGMLFVYQQPAILHFWMKGMKIPLSVGFFDENKRLMEIQEMEVPEKAGIKSYASKNPALYALEVPFGWFQSHGITPGMQLEWLGINNEKKVKSAL